MFSLPNIITLASLFSGCLALVLAMQGRFLEASYCVYLALIFDFLDGFVARLTKSASEIGVQLDSLSDMVSFAVAPTFIVFYFLVNTFGKHDVFYVLFVVILLSALRLAKFNISEPKPYFLGLPTPANAILLLAVPASYSIFALNYSIYLIWALFWAFMLIAPVKILALKKWDKSLKILLIALVLVGSVLIFLSNIFVAMGGVIVLWVLSSPFYFRITKQ